MEVSWNHVTLILVHLAMGVGLSASTGLRAFLPLFVVGLAGRFDFLPLSSSFEWLAGWPALVVFGCAVVVELAGDKFPVVDNFLDSFQTLVKPVAGAMVMASVVSEWSPLYVTVVAMLGGGAVAGTVHVAKAKLRLVSSAATVGAANPVISLAEDAAALGGSIASLVLPFLAAALVAVFLVVVGVAYRTLVGRNGPRPTGGGLQSQAGSVPSQS